MRAKVKNPKNIKLKKPKPNLHGPNSPTPKVKVLNSEEPEDDKTLENKLNQK